MQREPRPITSLPLVIVGNSSTGQRITINRAELLKRSFWGKNKTTINNSSLETSYRSRLLINLHPPPTYGTLELSTFLPLPRGISLTVSRNVGICGSSTRQNI